MEGKTTCSLLLNEPPLIVLPSLACLVGLNEAIFLQQLHYWVIKSTHIHEGRKWVFNSKQEWNSQFPFMGHRTLERVIQKLSKAHVVISSNHNNTKYNRVKWYTIDYDALNKLIDDIDTLRLRQNGGKDRHNLSLSIPPDWRNPFRQNGGFESAKLADSYNNEAETTQRLSIKKQPSKGKHIVDNSPEKDKPSRAAFIEKEKKKLTAVQAKRLQDAIRILKNIDGFNPVQYIHAHIKAGIPSDVTIYVLEEFVKHKNEIDDFWAYGKTILKRYRPEYNYQQSLEEHYRIKNAPVHINKILSRGD